MTLPSGFCVPLPKLVIFATTLWPDTAPIEESLGIKISLVNFWLSGTTKPKFLLF